MQRRYEAAGVGLYEDPWRAVQSIAAAVRCAERLATPPLPVPPVPHDLPALPRGPIAEHEAKRILAAAGVPVLDERLVVDAEEAFNHRRPDWRTSGAQDRLGADHS